MCGEWDAQPQKERRGDRKEPKKGVCVCMCVCVQIERLNEHLMPAVSDCWGAGQHGEWR
jgi:hypothetical protein